MSMMQKKNQESYNEKDNNHFNSINSHGNNEQLQP